MGNGLTRLWRVRRVRWGAAVAAGVLALGAAGAVALRTDAGEAPARPVTVAVDRGAVEVDVATTGTVQPATTRALGFALAGTVAKVAVRPGTVVQAGQQLATLSDADAAAAADAVEQARQELADAQDALSQARESTGAATNCATGAVQPVAWPPPHTSATPTPTPTPSGSASASASPAASASQPAATRPAPTSTGGALPPQDRPATGATTCSGGSRGGGGDPILDAERKVNQAETVLTEAEGAQSGTEITAPIRGTVLTVAGKVGTKVGRGATFITLADTFAMQVGAKFPEADAAAVAVGQHATVGLADQPGRTFPATVVQVDPVGTADGNMVRYGVLLSFTDAPEHLLLGQTAAVTVRTGSVADALRVPSTALHDVTDGRGTVRLGAGESRTVTIGLRGDQYTEVTSGLAAGDLVLRSW
ncbi:efflux RND transporter periplasmic adaptor subunit [Micromonospora sp. MS34]|uniref:efflux RND transporter periplasmic adaptor subunit n=1 Tax=Micromonospora sp. MS34 TaxID=3385971 RepID=UPI0039A2CB71